MNFGAIDTKILSTYQMEQVAALKHATRGSWAECRRALESSNWNFEAARNEVALRHT